MSALDGETLTLPAGLAINAGFGNSPLGNPYSDSPNSDMELAAIMAANQAREDDAEQNVLSPLGPSPSSQRVTAPARRFATLQPPPAAMTPSAPLAAVDDKTQPAPSTSPQMGWREQANAFNFDPNQSQTAPHPLLNDSRFWQAWRQDPQAAKKLYQGITGRPLESDLQTYAAGQKTLQESDKSMIEGMMKHGLSFDQVTGDPVMNKPVKGPDAQMAAYKGLPTPEVSSPLEVYEKAALARSYKTITGLDLPQGISTPRFTSPQEQTAFRQTVKQFVDKDRSQDPPAVKIQRASQKVQSQIWTSQQQAASIASNSAAANANPSNTFTRFLVKTANMGKTLGVGVTDTIGDLTGLELRGGTRGIGPEDLISTKDLQ